MTIFNRHLLTSTIFSSVMILTWSGAYAATVNTNLPVGGTYVAGSGTITQSGTQMTVNQASPNAVINYSGYNIGSGYTVTYNQPGPTSLSVNRVTGVNPSIISGNLIANGEVILVNPNGMVFTKDAHVNVQSLIATTSNITNANAMAGNLTFTTPSTSGTAAIVNNGTITAAQGGLVALVAPGVENNGTITATLGRVSLSSGNKWTLDLYGDRLVKFAVNDAVTKQVVVHDPDSLKTTDILSGAVVNNGLITVDAGRVELTVTQAKQVVDNSINMTGIIQATSASQQGGAIILDAGKTGIVSIVGNPGSSVSSLDASGTSGGTITINGSAVINQGNIRANGNAGNGGTINIAAADNYIDTEGASNSATGVNNATATGGMIAVQAGKSIFTSGNFSTIGDGATGRLSFTAPVIHDVGAAIHGSVSFKGKIDSNPNAPNPTKPGTFGSRSLQLNSGNILIADDTAQIGTKTNAGALYLYDGVTGQLISLAYGTHNSDYVGAGTVKSISLEKLVASSPYWDGKLGATTTISDVSGVAGPISDLNSTVNLKLKPKPTPTK